MARKTDKWIEDHGTVKERMDKDRRQGKEPIPRGAAKCGLHPTEAWNHGCPIPKGKK